MVSLSLQTPQHLRKIGLLHSQVDDEGESGMLQKQTKATLSLVLDCFKLNFTPDQQTHVKNNRIWIGGRVKARIRCTVGCVTLTKTLGPDV